MQPPVNSADSNDRIKEPNPNSLYLVLCKGNVIYAGITNDVEKRYLTHCSGKGAKFTRIRPPVSLLCHAVIGSRSEAQKVEYAVKRLPRIQKVAFVHNIASQSPASPAQ
jgi:putative endonuclease